MTQPDSSPEAIVTRFIEAIERQDLDTAIGYLSADCAYDNVPVGVLHGPDQVRAALSRLVERCDEICWPVSRSAANGPVVFNERLDRFRTGDSWIEIAVTGVWEVVDGRITLWRDYFDLETYRAQTS